MLCQLYSFTSSGAENVLNDAVVKDSIAALLCRTGCAGYDANAPAELENFGPDGSTRRFYRYRAGAFSCVAVLPGSQGDAERREAEAAFRIGEHLRNCGGAVPQIYGYDPKSGLVLYQDLGRAHLFDIVTQKKHCQEEDIRALYRRSLEALATIQIRGREGFQAEWCWDTSYYDRALVFEREAGYFVRCCWQGLLQKKPLPGLNEDFETLARVALGGDNGYFLHRDFQSRNIMVCEGAIRIIDFQGGRFGPLGYDVASLLRDPYLALSEQLQEELLEYYIGYVTDLIDFNVAAFRKSYHALAIQRNLQCIAAFCYLGLECKKSFFISYIRPALESLNRLFRVGRLPDVPVLEEIAATALCLLPEHFV